MNTQRLLETIGQIVRDGEHYDSRIICGQYGNAIITEKGYVIADPCYSLKDSDYRVLFTAKRRETFPDDSARDAEGNILRLSRWHEMEFEGQKCYWRDTGGDGVSFFGLCVDAGWIAAIPIVLCNEETKTAFETTPASCP